MDLKKRHWEKLREEKADRKRQVIVKALEVFTRQGIGATKMTDVARVAEVGVASLYRYFRTKPELVVETASYFWTEDINSYYHQYLNQVSTDQNGYELSAVYLGLYLDFFDNHKSIIRFIEEFDSYIASEPIPQDLLTEYGEVAYVPSQQLTAALRMGQEDGSVRADLPVQQFVSTAGHSLMALCQKHVSRSHIIPGDQDVDGRAEISFLIQTLLKYVKPSTA